MNEGRESNAKDLSLIVVHVKTERKSSSVIGLKRSKTKFKNALLKTSGRAHQLDGGQRIIRRLYVIRMQQGT